MFIIDPNDYYPLKDPRDDSYWSEREAVKIFKSFWIKKKWKNLLKRMFDDYTDEKFIFKNYDSKKMVNFILKNYSWNTEYQGWEEKSDKEYRLTGIRRKT